MNQPELMPSGMPGWKLLSEFYIDSQPGNELVATDQVRQSVEELGLTAKRLASLNMAVSEATVNAMEHGNYFNLDLPVVIQVLQNKRTLAIRVIDSGLGGPIPTDVPEPDSPVKSEGHENPRGWGLFLMRSLVDELHVSGDETHQVVELIMYLEGGANA